jgi:muramoyltetrapeptide carboxypeptidase
MIPKRLPKIGTIGVVSPSAPVLPNQRKQFRAGVRFFEERGLRVIVGRNALKKDGYSAGTPEQRAADINAMFRDKRVDAIVCSQGGDTANGVLPLLDYRMIARNPKIFMGISDITVLLNALWKKAGLVTFHGNDIMWGFGRHPTKYDVHEAEARLVRGETGLVNKNSKWRVVRNGTAEGTLVGGNLDCLLKLAGTEYFPETKNATLFLEDYNPRPKAVDHRLCQLKQMGVFDEIEGVLVGFIYGLEGKKSNMHDVLLRVTKGYDFPIVKCGDFGHNCPNTTLPIGTKARLSARGLELLEPCVR